jgi:hypothetical protein
MRHTRSRRRRSVSRRLRRVDPSYKGGDSKARDGGIEEICEACPRGWEVTTKKLERVFEDISNLA